MSQIFETPAVIIENPKYPYNVGAALRACSCYDMREYEMPMTPAPWGKGGKRIKNV